MAIKSEKIIKKYDISDLLNNYKKLKLKISRSRIYDLTLEPYEREIAEIVVFLKSIKGLNNIDLYKKKKAEEGISTDHINSYEDLINEYYIIAEKIHNKIEQTIKTQPKPFFTPLFSLTYEKGKRIDTKGNVYLGRDCFFKKNKIL